MEKTLTYSDRVKGWVSFYSFIPEMMTGMNSYLYSFKNGDLYKHNANESRNTFYKEWWEKIGQPLKAFNPSTVTTVLNPDINDVKVFKTIATDSDGAWTCDVVSNIDSGHIDADWFELKEGNYYAYIRRNNTSNQVISPNNLKMRSVQGIGAASLVDSADPANVKVTFTFNVGSIMSVNDTMYKSVSGTPVLVGTIINISGNIIYVDTTITGGSLPSAGDFLLYIKNSVAESYGTLGYYLQVKLENAATERTELFSVESNTFKSYP